MGKEWYHLVGRRSSSSTTSSSPSSNSYTMRGRGGGGREREASLATSSSSSTTTTGGVGGGGCMSSVFQFFDFHQFHFPLHHQPCFKFPASSHSFPEQEDPSTVLKGTEAPRNSLELDHGERPLPSSSNMIRKDEHLLTPAMGIQIKTGREKRSHAASLPDISSSPGTKTPTLVARLMGLDLLPDGTPSSPRPSSTLDIAPLIRTSIHASRTPHHRSCSGRKSCSDAVEYSGRGTRSLPETPRMSLGRRSDVDRHNRWSVQVNKENNNTSRTVGEDFDFSRFRKELKRSLSEDGTSRSPSHYARQIVKQVKESVSRRVGIKDITNTVRSRSEQGSTNKDQPSKPRKPPRNSRSVIEDANPSSCSPRFRFQADTSKIWSPHCPEAPSGWSNHTGEVILKRKPHHSSSNSAQISSSLKLGSVDGRAARLAAMEFTRNKQEEPFVRPSSKTTRTNHHMNNDAVGDKKCETTAFGIKKRGGSPTTAIAAASAAVLPVKKDPSPPATKIPHKQVHDIQASRHGSQLSVCASHKYHNEALSHVVRENKNMVKPSGAATSTATTSTTDRQVELQYVHKILQSAGIEGDTQLSSFTTKWFSPSHPLDPTIFSDLNSNCSTQLTDDTDVANRQSLDHRGNRKLVFQVVDELLADLLKPYLDDKSWIDKIRFHHCRRRPRRHALGTGSQLIDRIREEIESFPRADCQVLEDIDAIIDGDLAKSEVRSQSERAIEEEGGGLVSELELDIWEELVREVVTEEWAPRLGSYGKVTNSVVVVGGGALDLDFLGGKGAGRRSDDSDAEESRPCDGAQSRDQMLSLRYGGHM